MKRRGKARQTQHTPAKRKISEMIWEVAGDFIRQGKTAQDRQNRLIAASNAWNIASSPPERRQGMLDGLVVQYSRLNPGSDAAGLAAIRSDMEVLIARKLKMFPMDRPQIVSARLMSGDGQDRIEVMSATVG